MRRVNKGRNGGKTKAWRRPEVQQAVCLPVAQARISRAIQNGGSVLDVELPPRWGRWAKLLMNFRSVR